jgi:quinol monooxygenase YgiN
MIGAMTMSVTVGILVLLEAKSGKGDELAAFLQAGRELALAEEGTVTWYAFKISETRYAIFDTFAGQDGRTAHINGEMPKALARITDDLLAGEPSIQPVDIIAVK